MNPPTNAHEFVRYMEAIWEMRMQPREDGIVLFAHELYDTHHNAAKMIKFFGARRTGSSILNGELAHVWRFSADQGRAAVLVTKDGGGCKVSYHGFTQRKAKPV